MTNKKDKVIVAQWTVLAPPHSGGVNKPHYHLYCETAEAKAEQLQSQKRAHTAPAVLSSPHELLQ